MTTHEAARADWRAALVSAIEHEDPLLFATGVLGFLMPGEPNPGQRPQLEAWQVTALKKFRRAWRRRFERPGRLSIRAGHGVGKSCFLAVCILYVLVCAGPDTKVPVVANSQDQLRDALWPEIAKWIARLPDEVRDALEWQKERVVVREAPESAFAVARTASVHRPEALQGIHARNVLAIFEEASGIPEQTVESGIGTLSTPGAVAIACGNPTRASGFFHATHTRLRDVWDTMAVSSLDVPRARGHVEDVIRLYGKDSNKYRVRVLGEFPTHDDDVVIPLEWVEAARGRDVAISHCWPVWGVDVARFGDDRTVLAKRQGNTLLEPPIAWSKLDGPQVAGRIIAEYERTATDRQPREICVDVIGVGSSVVDHLRLPGSPVRHIVTAVNVAEAAPNDEGAHRLRDELWWRAREWFASRACTIPAAGCEGLIAELTTPTYDFTVLGKRVVESKDEYKRRIGQSSDAADAFIMTFAGGTHLREPTRRWRDEGAAASPWAA
ncbi:MAG TPA: hypothetical protein VNK52_16140 [Hyphomicrobiaceae bacterium]|nr:hypothetical protein [Hyphomicrobiaceae bacterium]